MKPQSRWLERTLLGVVLLLAAEHLVFQHVLPEYFSKLIRQATSNRVSFGRVQVGLPCRVVFSDVTLEMPSGANLWSPHVVLTPRAVLWRPKVLSISTMTVEGLSVRVTRLRDGKVEWPMATASSARSSTPSVSAPTPMAASPSPVEPGWRVAIEILQVVNGTLEFVDEKLNPPFRATLRSLALTGGPLVIPLEAPEHVALALQGELTGAQEHTAPLYCSGWLVVPPTAFDLSCQLEPLRLAAFDPYYQGAVQVRTYEATFKATAHAVAQDDALDARMQLEINQLNEADLSYSGRTIVDMKRIANGAEPMLSGELQITGPLDRPAEWRYQLAAGNELLQRLIKQILDRPVRIKMGQQMIHVDLTPVSPETRSNMEAARKTIQDSLRILAPTSPAVAEPVTPAEASGPSPEGSSVVPANAPAPPETTTPAEPATQEPSTAPNRDSATP